MFTVSDVKFDMYVTLRSRGQRSRSTRSTSCEEHKIAAS